MKTNQKTVLQRTMIAAAIAALSAGAFAADSQWPGAAPEGANTEASWDKVAENNAFNYKDPSQPDSFLAADADHDTFSGNLWVTGSGNSVQATGLWADNALTLENTGSIYVTSAEGAKSWSQHAMGADHGATAVNNGTIVAKKAYGMFVGSKEKSTIVNGASGTIYVEDEGAGMELGGAAGSEAFNYGKIYAGAPSKDVTGSFSHGVLIQDQTNGTFTNAGLIQAAEDAQAIEIKGSSDNTTVNLVQGSHIVGAIDVSATGSTTFYVKNVTDTLDLAVAETAGTFKLNVTDGSNLTLNEGHSSKIDFVTVENARLNASIWGADNKFGTVTVNEGGVFNVLKLNSGGDKDHLDTKPHNQLLFKGGSHFTFDGGKLYVAGSEYHGKVKVGTLGGAAASLTFDNGSFAFSDMTVGSNSEFAVNNGADVALDNLLVYQADPKAAASEANKGGHVTVTGHLTVNNDITFETPDAKLALNGGKLTVAGDFLFTKAEGADDWSATDAWTNNVTQKDGLVEVIDSIGEYSLSDLKAAQDLLNGGNSGTVQLVFLNGGLKLEEGESLTGTNVSGLNLADQVGVATTGAFDVTADTTLAGVDFGNAETATISTGDGTLTLSGNNSNVFSGLKDTTKTVNVTGTLTLGTDSASAGTVNVENLTVDNLNVVGNFNAQTVDVSEAASITGSLTAASLAGGEYTVQDGGKLAFDVTNANVTAEAGSTVIFGKAQPQQQPEARAVSLQPQIADGITQVTAGAVATTNAAMDEAAFAAAYAGKGYDAAKMVDSSVVLGEQATLRTASSTGTDGIRLNTAFAVINANAFSTGGDPVFQAKDLGIYNSTIYLDGLRSEKTITFFDGQMKEADIGAGNGALKDSNVFLDGKLTLNADKTATELQIAYQATGTEVDDYLPNLLREGGDAGLQNLYAAIGNVDGPFVSSGKLTNEGVQASNEVAAMPVTAGTYNVAYDAAEQVTGTVQRRNLEPSTGLGVWADVFYSTNEAKSIYGGQGYSADIYGGTIGFDGTFSCGAKLGLALSVGSGDADSEKSVGKYSNDADFYGVTVYTGKDIAGLYFSADASYLWLDNDISGQVAGASVKDSIDSNVFTVGVRADMTVYDQAFKVVPHVGMRYTNIDVDNYRGIESDSMNVFEMPIGVKVAGDFEPAAGWKLTPSFDFTVVPQVGDKNVSTLVGNVDVLDNLYNSTLGVNATYGNFAFGLSYRYGFGNDDRSNNAFQARASYQF